MLDMARGAFCTVDRLAGCGGGLPGTGLSKQGSGLPKPFDSDGDGVTLFGRRGCNLAHGAVRSLLRATLLIDAAPLPSVRRVASKPGQSSLGSMIVMTRVVMEGSAGFSDPHSSDGS